MYKRGASICAEPNPLWPLSDVSFTFSHRHHHHACIHYACDLCFCHVCVQRRKNIKHTWSILYCHFLFSLLPHPPPSFFPQELHLLLTALPSLLRHRSVIPAPASQTGMTYISAVRPMLTYVCMYDCMSVRLYAPDMPVPPFPPRILFFCGSRRAWVFSILFSPFQLGGAVALWCVAWKNSL